MQKIIGLLLLILTINSIGYTQLPSYTFAKPAGWESETFPLPPGFAPEIVFKGVEDIRFTPGWAKSTSEQYWSYAFIWLLEGKQVLSEKVLSNYITAYYTGIYTVNLRDKPAPKPGFTTSSFQKIKSAKEDAETYEGSVQTLNYLTHQTLSLHVRVHYRKVAKASATVMLFEVSPQPYTHSVWQELSAVILGFTLTKEK